MRPVAITFPAASTTSVAASQTPGSARRLILNGPLADSLALSAGDWFGWLKFPGYQRIISLTSGANLSAINFTVTGFDVRNQAISQTIAGPNINTVATTTEFYIVSSIAANADVNSAISAGTGSTGSTIWIMTDLYTAPANITVTCDITATVNWTVQDTPVDVVNTAPAASNIFNHPILAALTASAESNYAYPPRFVRGVMNSSSGAGACTMTLVQSGLGN